MPPLIESRHACLRLLPLTGLLFGACAVPIGGATPQSATTVGTGNTGYAVIAEGSQVDLILSRPSRFSDAKVGTGAVHVSHGLSDELDLELGLELVWLGPVPFPHGVSGGVRRQLSRSRLLAVAGAARAGLVTGSEIEFDHGDEPGPHVRAGVGQVAVGAQLWPSSWFRPGLSVSLASAGYEKEWPRETTYHWASAGAATASLTLAWGRLELAPFLCVTHAYASEVGGRTTILTGGGSIAFRPQP